MIYPSLAIASDYVVWASLVVLALALLAFSANLAVAGSRKEAPGARAVDAASRTGAGASAASERTLARTADGDPAGTGATAVATLERPEPGSDPAPNRRWGVVGLQLTWLATFGVIGATVLRALSVQRAPVGNMYEFTLASSSFVLLVYSVWAMRRDRLWLGAFVVLPVMAMLGIGKIWYTEASQLMPALNSIWIVIHVPIACLSVALFTIGAALAVAYLLKERAEERGRVPGWLAGLPDATRLEQLTYGIHVFAFPLWTFTVISGAIWAERAWGRFWGWDPKEVWSFVIWAVYAAYLHARATSGWSTRQATYVALMGLVCVALNFTVVNLMMTGLHSYSGVSN